MKSFIYTILMILAVNLSAFAQLQAQNELVNMFTLRKLVRETPDQKDKILSQANEISGQETETRLFISQHAQIADMFLTAGIYLENAEDFANKGLKACDLKKFIESSKEVFKKNNASVQTDEAITLDFWKNKARLLSLLGRIQIKLGKTSEAEINLTESHKLNRMDSQTALVLSEIIEKKGDTKTAFDYLIPAVFSNGVKQTLIEQLEKLYQINHGGKLDGLDKYLDKKYHELFPFKVETYQPTAKRTKRIVLAELFSGSGCPPCVAADLAYDGILQRYNRRDVAVLVYHLHNPRPDPMANEENTIRSNFYGLRGAPAVAFDGNFFNYAIGSPDWDQAKPRFDDFTAKIEKALETEPDADLNLNVSKTGSMVKVKATVGNIKKPSENLKLHLMLAEDSIRYNGENGIWFHPFVVRSMVTPDAKGLTVDASKANSFEHTFDVAKISENLRIYLDEFEKNPPKEFDKYGGSQFRKKLYAIDDKNLSIVAFVQDEKTKEVLQTVYFKVN